jgi:hypothetical protein
MKNQKTKFKKVKNLVILKKEITKRKLMHETNGGQKRNYIGKDSEKK